MTTFLSSKALRRALYGVPVLCISGLVISVIGQLAKQQLMARVGTGVFLCGPVVFGLVFGGTILFLICSAFREAGFRSIRARPIYFLLHFVGSIAFISISCFLLWVVMTTYFLPR